MIPFRIPSCFAAALILIFCGTGAARASTHTKRASHAVGSVRSGSAQVNGIVSSIVDDLWAQNDEYWHRGDYARIVALDRIITGADPAFVECYATGAWLMESLGDLTSAEAYYQEGARNNTDVAYAHFNLASFYFNTLKDYRAAAMVFRRGARQKDADINDWRMLAHAYEHAGDIDNCILTWKAIKARWPSGLNVDKNLARILKLQKSGAAPGGVHLPGPPLLR